MSKNEVIRVLSAHKAELRAMGVSSLALFGSTVRNNASRESDVDLVVEFDPDEHVGLFGFIELQHRLEKILDVTKVDLVMREAILDELKDAILDEAVSIV